MKKTRKRRKADKTLQNGVLPSDVLGSYTGVPDSGEIPEQDADDL